MPTRKLRLDPTVALEAGFAAVRRELEIPAAFPPEVLAEAAAVVARGPEPQATEDLRNVPFLTIDPEESTDLDQAVALERAGTGYVVHYAIADVGAFVTPGGALDAEARRRGVTVYLPDGRTSLHPEVLSEGVASLLPDVDRQALAWEIRLDAGGEPQDVRVRRAVMRSRAKLSYEGAQRALDDGTADEQLLLLREIGVLREASEAARGGVSLPIPEQRVVEVDGRYHLEFRSSLGVEGWNAQISLLTGACAARLMLDAGIGVLRTLPAPDPETVDVLRRHAVALRVPWPAGSSYGDVIRSLSPGDAAHDAFLLQAVRLFRGAGYVAFDGDPPQGPAAEHAAVASPYAHVTAPLRRLVDRFANEVVLAICGGTAVPELIRAALPSLPALMTEAGRREGAADGMATDLVEAATLGGCIGAELDGVVVRLLDGRARVQVREPAVVADVALPDAELGAEVRLRVAAADVGARSVTFEPVLPPA